MRVDRGRYFGNLSFNFVDRAFWQDVLNAPFHGWTDPYSLVNGGFGVRSADGRLMASVQVANVFDRDVQQHIFGDIIKRSITAQVRYRF